MTEDLIELERAGWRALSSDGADAKEFYGRITDDVIAMALPGGVLIDDRAAVLESMSGPPWSRFRLGPITVLRPTPDVGIVVYEASAERDGGPGVPSADEQHLRAPWGRMAAGLPSTDTALNDPAPSR